MNLFSRATVVVLALTFSSAALAVTAPVRREYLGQTKIEKSTDTDTILVRSCATLNKEVRAIKLKFTRNPATLYRVKITFGDGSSQIYWGNQWYPVGGTTGWMDLSGGFRCVHDVQITANGSGGKSIIELYGETTRR